ncbi:MAG: lytic transglycosylase domain-containing protein [Vulcanimicrobiaceae bacterium]
MSLVDDLRAVEGRIAQIAGAGAVPVLPRPSPGGAPAFGKLVARSLDALLEPAARASGVDAALVEAVIANESGFNPRATSPTGAQGLMQLMPSTAAALGVGDSYDPAQNVRGGATYLRQLLDRFGGDLRAALAAYNAGPGAVERYGGVPPFPETRAYVERVLATYRALGGDP